MENKSELITILHLIVVFTLYFIFAIVISNVLNFSSGKFDETTYKKRNIFIIFLEILLEILIVFICAFYSNVIISNIAMPFDTSLSRATSMQASGGIIVSFMMMIFQTNMKKKIEFLYKKITKYDLNA
jgi:hypothetical protein